jgi:hypothetical protein
VILLIQISFILTLTRHDDQFICGSFPSGYSKQITSTRPPPFIHLNLRQSGYVTGWSHDALFWYAALCYAVCTLAVRYSGAPSITQHFSSGAESPTLSDSSPGPSAGHQHVHATNILRLATGTVNLMDHGIRCAFYRTSVPGRFPPLVCILRSSVGTLRIP